MNINEAIDDVLDPLSDEEIDDGKSSAIIMASTLRKIQDCIQECELVINLYEDEYEDGDDNDRICALLIKEICAISEMILNKE